MGWWGDQIDRSIAGESPLPAAVERLGDCVSDAPFGIEFGLCYLLGRELRICDDFGERRHGEFPQAGSAYLFGLASVSFGTIREYLDFTCLQALAIEFAEQPDRLTRVVMDPMHLDVIHGTSRFGLLCS